jgi:DNA-binding NarL/FixJ family response regulator
VANILIVSEDADLIAKWSEALAEKYRIETANRFPNTYGELGTDIMLVILDAEFVNREPTLMNHIKNFSVKIFVTGRQWPEKHQIMALIAGASGYCETTEPIDLLTKAAASVIKGDIWIQRHLIPKVIGSLVQLKQPAIAAPPSVQPITDEMLNHLSEREREVANMVVQGDSNKKIGSALDISERTVKAHLTSIFKKLHVTDRLQLAVLLKETGK